MAHRREPPDGLDDFPTPPWATRALCELLVNRVELQSLNRFSVWEPACNRGYMADPLAEYFELVEASDIFDYGFRGAPGCWQGEVDFLGWGEPRTFDWIITNPPFRLALEFAKRAFALSHRGVALLVRTQWLESGERFRELFQPAPPSYVAVFCERPAMVKGRYDPVATTATSYSWVIWQKPLLRGAPALLWIPPGTKARLYRASDARLFAEPAPVPLFDEGRFTGGTR